MATAQSSRSSGLGSPLKTFFILSFREQNNQSQKTEFGHEQEIGPNN